MTRKPKVKRVVRCDSCSGSGWISTGEEYPEEGPQYRRCDDCSGIGEHPLPRREVKK